MTASVQKKHRRRNLQKKKKRWKCDSFYCRTLSGSRQGRYVAHDLPVLLKKTLLLKVTPPGLYHSLCYWISGILHVFSDDELLTPPPPRERLSYTRYQLELLNGIYLSVRYPNSVQKQLIAKRVGISREQVKVSHLLSQCFSLL